MKNEKILVCGPPGAGKTTFSRQLGERLNIPVLTVDDLEVGNFSPKNWKDARNQAADFAQSSGLVIVEDTFHLSSMRKRYRPIMAVIWLDLPVEECIRRNNRRINPVPEAVIRKMCDEFEPVGKKAWEKNLKIFRLPVHVDHVVSHLAPMITEPSVTPSDRRNEINVPHVTDLQRLDLSLRRSISEQIAATPREIRQQLAQQLNQRRQEILAQARSTGNFRV